MTGSVPVDAKAGARERVRSPQVMEVRVGQGARIEMGDGGGAAYLAVPRSGRGPGVVVLPPEAGLPDVAVSACERLAREGFVAVAPDLARCDTEALAPDETRTVCDAAVEGLFRETATERSRVGALGLGRGAALAFELALRDARLAALAVFGGASELAGVGDPAGRLEVPLLAVFGEKDPALADGRIHELEASLAAAGAPCDLRALPGVGADFHDEARADAYDPAAAEAAWDAALALLRAELS